jgi:dolichol-phosphate mannosyltransferase
LEGTDHEIIIVDDNSSDRTWELAEEIAESNARVRVLRRMVNPGLSASVIDGFSAARGVFVACIDSDLQHEPTILQQMLGELLNGHDLAIGCRYMAGGRTGNWQSSRRWISLMATKMAQLFLGITLRDPLSGYFMMRRDDFLRIRDRLDGSGFKILLEVVANAEAASIIEVPYSFRPRVAGASKLTSTVALRYLYQLWRIRCGVRQRSCREMNGSDNN